MIHGDGIIWMTIRLCRNPISICEWPLINQQLRQQESAQPMNRTVPTTFRGTRRLQQPKPFSTTPLSASTATHNTNLYGTIAFWGRECLAIQMPLCLLVRLCSKKKVDRKKRGKTRNRMCFFKNSIQFKARAHHANFPLPLPPIVVWFKIIKIITAT